MTANIFTTPRASDSIAKCCRRYPLYESRLIFLVLVVTLYVEHVDVVIPEEIQHAVNVGVTRRHMVYTVVITFLVIDDGPIAVSTVTIDPCLHFHTPSG